MIANNMFKLLLWNGSVTPSSHYHLTWCDPARDGGRLTNATIKMEDKLPRAVEKYEISPPFAVQIL